MKNGDECKTEPTHEDVGDKHSAVVETRFGHKILSAMVASGFHVEGSLEGKRAGVEQVGRMAGRAFKSKYAVRFAAF